MHLDLVSGISLVLYKPNLSTLFPTPTKITKCDKDTRDIGTSGKTTLRFEESDNFL